MKPGTTMGLPFLAALAVVLFVQPFARASPGTVQGSLDVLEVESRIFENKRKLRVWLPPAYTEPTTRERSYPVLYLNDGQDLFDRPKSLGPEDWRVDELLDKLVSEARIEPLIVVGIDNAGRGRPREYLPYPDKFLQPTLNEPQGRLYGQFLAEEVIPLIEGRYRVAPGRAARGLGGSSYGALVALHVAVTRPELFSRLLLESPSLYVDDAHVLRDAAAAQLDLERVYLGVGTNESALPECPNDDPDNAEAVADVEKLARILIGKGLRDGVDLQTFVEDCGEHNEKAWTRRRPSALGFLYGPRPKQPED